MKHVFAISALFISMGTSIFVNADVINGVKGKDQKTLSVTAKIDAPTCEFVLNGGVPLDFGTITPGSLKLNEIYQPSRKPISLSVTCDAKAMVQMTVQDTYLNTLRASNRDGLPHGAARQFGLVDANDTSKLFGSYTFFLKKITLSNKDGSTGDHGMTVSDGGATNEILSTKTNEGTEPATLVVGHGNQYAEKMEATFDVEASFLPASKLDLGRDVSVVGEATFKMVYL
ncbi:DUF1120 domain-containing protein [Pseudomonas marginalis]|uniref:DUF1120 domain-containing protein n=1 Tax=Pseudomonas marginalis TaxID=298 RepID=UPI003BA244FB